MKNEFINDENRKVLGMVPSLKGGIQWLGGYLAIFLLAFTVSANAQLSGKGSVTRKIAK